MARYAFPWKRPQSIVVEDGAWEFSIDTPHFELLPGFMPYWDNQGLLKLRRTFGVDMSALLDQIDARGDSWQFGLHIELGTGQGSLARIVIAEKLVCLGVESVNIELSVRPDQLSNQIVLNSSLVILKVGTSSSDLAPAKAGARLWSDQHICLIDNSEPRFPMQAVSFEELFADRVQDGALWYLHWNPFELDRDIHGAIRLYLNLDDSDFIGRVKAEDSSTLQLILGGVMGQVCSTILCDDSSEDILENAEPNTLAANVSRWLELAFDSASHHQIRSILKSRPGEFFSALLSIARF